MKKLEVRRKYRRLSPTAWAEIRALWEVGDVTLADLSHRYGVATRTLQAHFEKHEVKKGAKARALAAIVEAELLERALDDPQSLADRARETRESAYKDAATIQKLVMAELGRAASHPGSAFQSGMTIKMLALAAHAVERARRIRWTALGLADGEPLTDELPELVIRTYTESELEDIRNRVAAGADRWDGGLIEGTSTAEAEKPSADEDLIETS
jgi:hypothetical protein